MSHLNKLADAIINDDADVLDQEAQRIEDDKERRRRRARRTVDKEERPEKPIPPSMTLTDRFRLKKHPIKWRIEKVMKIGQRVIINAQYKAGKTTLAANIVRSLVDGVNFLDAFEVSPVDRVTVLDFEMAEDEPNMLDEVYEAIGIENTSGASIKALRGRGSSFNVLDEDVRARWAADLRGTTVLIVDCLRPILDALGLDENRDAGKFFTAFDALLNEAGIREAIIVHHMGHQHERSRGDSRILDYPDAIWTLVRQTDDPASPRFFKAFGRGIDLKETAITYNAQNHRMSLGQGSRVNAAALAALPAVLDLLRQHGPLSKKKIEEGVAGHTRDAIREAIEMGQAQNSIGMQKRTGKGGGWEYLAALQLKQP